MISPLVGLDLVMLVVSTVGFGLGLSAVWENWSSESAIRCLAGTLVWSCVLAQFGRSPDCWLDLVMLVVGTVGFGLGLSAVWENWSSELAIRCLAGTLVWSCLVQSVWSGLMCWVLFSTVWLVCSVWFDLPVAV